MLGSKLNYISKMDPSTLIVIQEISMSPRDPGHRNLPKIANFLIFETFRNAYFE